MQELVKSSVVACVATALLAVPATAVVAQESAPPAPANAAAAPESVAANAAPAEQLKVWDEAVEILRQGLWRAQSDPAMQVKDSRGRTMAEDLNDHILTPATSEQLEKLRDEARGKETDEAAVKDILDRAEPLMKSQVFALGVIGFYWRSWFTVNHHQKILEPLLANAPAPDRESIRVHLVGTEKGLVDRLDASLAQPPADMTAAVAAEMMYYRDATVAATRFYNERRLALVQQQSAAQASQTLKSHKRQTDCPAPVQATGTRDKPGLAPDNAPLEEVYPPVAKAMSVEGPVTLRVTISETGCMEQADLVTSSGAEDLDDAALLWAEQAKFLPASKDGKGVPGSFAFRVKFELKE